MVIEKGNMNQYRPEIVEEMQAAIKGVLGPMFEAMLQGEMDAHLGYESNERCHKTTTNRRNGYTYKTVNSTVGSIDIRYPRDRDGSFEPIIIPKRIKDVSRIEDIILLMYANWMSRRDITAVIQDIYGTDTPRDIIYAVTDRIIETVEEWRKRPLQSFYTYAFAGRLYVTLCREMKTKRCAVYVIFGYGINGIKDVLGIYIEESKGKYYWTKIFNEIKNRGVEDIRLISIDGPTDLGIGIRSVFTDILIQQ